jgi:hypothetical protein
MIYTDSRYNNGLLVDVYDTKTNYYQLTVFRAWPNASNYFSYYTWEEGDRIDVISNQTYGNPSFWWKIMDYNPEILNPFNIAPGTVLRIPNG